MYTIIKAENSKRIAADAGINSGIVEEYIRGSVNIC
jgi:hypothetical protein